ncbi:MAG TPA: hypothetical protein VH088_11890 [Terriglobales bacterium]|jgi:hypothetical protein|nr:hypothetical protein [Terriglobales bacterium]
MPRHSRYVVLLLLLSSFLVAKAKKEKAFPALITNARYVFVTTYFGNEPANTRIMPSDRRAVADVETAIQKWGRYTLAHQANDAEIIILVRKGRYAEGLAGIHVHGGSDQPNTTITPEVNADGGDPQDMIAVYDASMGIDTSPLWRGRERDGLNPPDMQLVKELRAKIEEAAKKP